MGIEFKSPLLEDQQVDKKSKGNEKKKHNFNPDRRKFLKWAGGLAIAGSGASGAYKLAGMFSDDENAKNNKPDSRKNLTQKDELTGKAREEYEALKTKQGINPLERETKNIADVFLKAYYELSRSKFWPADVFTTDFFIAQQLQESKYKKEAESQAGALGIMQNMEVSIKDVVRYLNKLKSRGKYNYNGPEELADKQLTEIKELIKERADYSRAFGKLYLIMLKDPQYGYGIARNEYKRGDIKETQKKLLANYNGGLGNVGNRPEGLWPRESKDYCKKVFNYMERIENIRQALKDNGFDQNNDYAVMLLAREMDKAKNKSERKQILDMYVNKIIAEQKIKDKPLTDEEIKLIFLTKKEYALKKSGKTKK